MYHGWYVLRTLFLYSLVFLRAEDLRFSSHWLRVQAGEPGSATLPLQAWDLGWAFWLQISCFHDEIKMS